MKKFKFTISGKPYEVEVQDIEGNIATVNANGTEYKVEMEEQAAPVVAPVARPAAKPAAAAEAPKTIAPAHCDWDPNAQSVHPGFTNKQLQAFLSIAAIAALEEHPGLTNDELVVIMTAAATQVLGQPCRVTAYKNVNSPAWTIV